MTHLVHPDAIKPWYKQPWLWFLMSIPIASVITSSIFVTIAVVGRDSLVSDNYYKDGMAINQTIGQDQLAVSLGLEPVLSFSGSEVTLQLKGSSALAAQPFLTLKILHPTIGAEDIELKLLPTADGVFLGDLPHAVEGRRYLDLYAFDTSWRIREEVYLPIEKHTMNKHLLK